MDLYTFWFLTLGVLLGGYAVLDGFDLGVGIVHLGIRGDTERRLAMNSIGPLWDGNEVWLVTFGGALFAAFPEAYATIFSSFYLPFMALLAALIGRAVSIEFRSKVSSAFWRRYWDFSFFLSSLVAVLLFGVAVGNIIQGIPVGADREFAGDVSDLLGIYPIGVGMLAVVMSALHGSLYLCLKTDGELQERVGRWRIPLYAGFLVGYIAISLWTLVLIPRVLDNFYRWPVAWGVVLVKMLAVVAIPIAVKANRPGWAFVGSSVTILSLIATIGLTIFPNLVVSSLSETYNMDIVSCASSLGTLGLMRTIVILGFPCVLAYTITVYWIFRGKTKLDEFSY
ncbi:MAG: cytochrome d ubiquinol oxidase subunit II [Myxococcales bacterium]|nr:cytochrome d ubiquinol oxidase subunit II [Myxococcales bacterium]